MRYEEKFIYNLLKSYLNKNEDMDFFYKFRTSLNYERLIKKCFAHGLEGIAYYEFNRLGILNLIDRRIAEKLKWGSRNTLMVNMLLLSEFKNIVELLRKNNIEPVPVKGIVFVKKLYENLSLRSMADIDLILREKDYKYAIEILKSAGYRESDFLQARKWERENFRIALTKPDLIPLTVELHKKFSHPGRFGLSADDALDNLGSAEIDEMQFRTLNPDYTFLFLINHMGMHYFNLKLIWVVDAVKFLLEFTPDWSKILDYVEQYRLRTSLYMLIKLISPYLNIEEKLGDVKLIGNLKKLYLKIFYSEKHPTFFRFPWMPLRLSQIFCVLPLIDDWKNRGEFFKNYIKIRMQDYQ